MYERPRASDLEWKGVVELLERSMVVGAGERFVEGGRLDVERWGEDWLRRQLYPIAVGCGSRFGDAQRQAARNLMLACPRKSFEVKSGTQGTYPSNVLLGRYRVRPCALANHFTITS